MKTDERPEAAAIDERARIRRGVLHCLWVFLGARVGLSIVAVAALALIQPLDPPVDSGWALQPLTPGWHNWVTAWERFDALWFLRIGTEGYTVGDGSAVFFPLFPLLIRGFSPVLGGHPLAAAIVVGNLAYLGGLIATYFLTEGEWGEAAARRAVLYLAVFPAAFFLLAPYSEPVFLLLAVTSLWAARRSRWAVAGLCGALAAATRNLGLVLVLPLVFEAWHQRRERGAPVLGPLLWSAAVGLGTLAYLLFWQVKAGDPLAPVTFQTQWQRELTFPLETLRAATEQAFSWFGQFPGGYHFLDWLVVVPILGAGVWVALRARPMFSIYVWATLLVPLSYPFPPRPLLSVPRFLLPLIPLFWALAVWSGKRRGVHEAVLVVSGVLLGVMTALFVTWHHVF
ncbi:MAG TPA: mannosyltransferase family protein [Actinomycetota bacterium]